MGRSTDVSIKEPITDKRPEFIDGKEINLGPVVCEWCYFAKPDDDVYKCEALLDEKMALSFAAAGVNVKRREDGQHYVDVKRKAHMGAPEVWAADGATEVDGFKVGNGSKLILKVWMKYVDYKGVHLPLRLNKVQVAELVEYVPEGDGDSGSGSGSHGSGFAPIGDTTGDDVPF